MDFVLLTIWILFVFSAALSVTGVLLLFRLKQKHEKTDFRQIHYALVLLYTFGFYVLWGRLFIRIILPETNYVNNYDVIQNVNQALGIPFLFSGFVLLVHWIYRNSEIRKASLKLIISLLFIVVSTIMHYHLSQYSFFRNTVQVNLVLMALFAAWTALSFLFLCKCIQFIIRISLAFGYGFLAIGNLLMLFYFSSLLSISILNMLYFIVVTSSSVAIYYGLNLQKESEVISDSSERIFLKYGITLREREVIREIRKGYTNQQIADKLFITLQTVKDHNSRIYLKLGVTNRTQLVKLFHDGQL